MDWLKDKKNQPIVAAALAVIIIGAGAAVYFTMFAGSSPPPPPPPSDTTTTPTGPEASAGYPTAAPGSMEGAYPSAPGGGAPATQVAAGPAPTPPGGAVPMEVWRPDPFLPAGYTPPNPNKPRPRPPIKDLPILMNFSQVPVRGAEKLIPDIVQPVRRMSGLIVSDRIYAIIETVGEPPQIVQPGDMLDDHKAKVERIERDMVILKTMDRVPKYITIRMAAAPRSTVNVSPSTSGTETPPSPIGPSDRGRRPYDRGGGVGEPMAPM
jgi:hypothetical protein